MPLTELFAADLATATVSSGGTTAPVSGTVETWTVASSAMFGSASTGVSQFHVADSASGKGAEIIAVTNVAGTTWTVTRGADSTTPVTHSGPFTVQQVVPASWLNGLGTGAVSSAFGRTGAVVATTGDYSVGQVTGAAPLASPTFTGTPAAPTPSALDNSTKVGTTAYADAAVAVEKARALAGEALALPKAGGTMSGAIAMGGSKVTGLGNGSGAQDAAAFGQLPSSSSPLALTAGGTGQSAGSAATLLAALGAAQLAGAAFTGEVTVQAPVNPSDAVTKAYADAIAQSLAVKPSVQEATAAALPSNTYTSGVLTATANGALTVDGIAVSTGDRVLVQNEAAPASNGIYTVTAAGSGGTPYVLTRAADMASGTQVPGAFVFTEQGTVNAGGGFTVASKGPFTIGTTAITWTQFSGAGEILAGTSLVKSGNTISLAASPALAGTPTTPTATALTGNTQIASTAYADLAVAVEKVRALAAEAGLLPLAGGTLTGSLTVGGAFCVIPQNLIDASSIAVNAALSNSFRVTLGGNRTLANPSNPTDGQLMRVLVIQDGTGSRTLAYGTAYQFPAGIGTPVLSSTPGYQDALVFEYESATTAWWCRGYTPQAVTAVPVTVSGGGTGLATTTPYALLAGGTTGTGNLQQLAGLGTAGQSLISGGPGALPSFQTAPPYAAAYLMPTGAIAETFSRVASINSVAGTSGTLYVSALGLEAGKVISNITHCSGGTAAVTPTHWWFALYDSSLNLLAITADQTTTAFGINTGFTLAIATIAAGAASSFTTTYSGLHYVGFMMTAGTMPTLVRLAGGSIAGSSAIPPILASASDTGLTTPSAFPHTAAALTKANSISSNYAYVS